MYRYLPETSYHICTKITIKQRFSSKNIPKVYTFKERKKKVTVRTWTVLVLLGYADSN